MKDFEQHPNAHFFGATHVGRARSSNQDNYLIGDMRRLLNICDSSVETLDGQSMVSNHPGQLLMVADGMGGHAHGEYASRLAIRYMTTYVANLMPRFLVGDMKNDDEFQAALKEGPVEIHRLLRKEGQADPTRAEMGTTLTVAYIDWPALYLVHVGDSRCYLFRDGRLNQLTTDHTVSQYLSDAGQLTPDRAQNGSLQHMLWNSVSAAQTPPEPQVKRELLQPADYVLLCSDGLIRHLATEQIAEILGSQCSVPEKANQLIDETNRRGGRDNTSVVIGYFEGQHDPKHCFLDSDHCSMIQSLVDTDIEFSVMN